jgi:hypothetical protein
MSVIENIQKNWCDKMKVKIVSEYIIQLRTPRL